METRGSLVPRPRLYASLLRSDDVIHLQFQPFRGVGLDRVGTCKYGKLRDQFLKMQRITHVYTCMRIGSFQKLKVPKRLQGVSEESDGVPKPAVQILKYQRTDTNAG